MSILKGGSQTEYYLSFDGVDDYVNINNNNINLDGDWEINIKLSWTNSTKEHYLFSLGYSENDSLLLFSTQNEINIISKTTTNLADGISFNIDLNRVYEYKLKHFNGNNYELYMDGNLIHSFSLTTPVFDSSNVQLGWAVPRNKSTAYFQGRMYYFDIIDDGTTVLKYDFSEGSGNTLNDVSGNGNNGTIVGATWQVNGQSTEITPTFDNQYFESNVTVGDNYPAGTTRPQSIYFPTTPGLEYDVVITNANRFAFGETTNTPSAGDNLIGGFRDDSLINSLPFTYTYTATSNFGWFYLGFDFSTIQVEVFEEIPTPAIDNIYYGIPSVAYTLDGASYDNKSLNVSSQDNFPLGLTFNDDGTQLIVLGFGIDRIFEYDLTTAYDISTASYTDVYFDISSQASTPRDLVFNGNGTKLYVVDIDGSQLYEYDLSTPYDISTASYNNVNVNVISGVDSIEWNNDGSKFYLESSSSIYEYSTSNYNINNLSLLSSTSFSSFDNALRGFQFNSDGSKLIILGNQNKTFYQFTLATPYDISTYLYDNLSFTPDSSRNEDIFNFILHPDDSKLYYGDYGFTSIYQYSMGEQPIYSTIDKVYAGQELIYGELNKNYQVIYDSGELASPTTSISITGLDITKDDKYIMIASVDYNATGNLYLYANGNTTNSNYYFQEVFATTLLGANRYNYPSLQYGGSNDRNFFHIDIKLNKSGYIQYQTKNNRYYGTSSLSNFSRYNTSTFTANTITQLDITGEASNLIGSGSRFILVKAVS